MMTEMTKYKHTELEDEETSSVNSMGAFEGVTHRQTEIRFHSAPSIWNDRTIIEKFLFISCLILLVIVLFMGISLSTVHHDHESLEGNNNYLDRNNSKYCLTQACVAVAAAIINALDTTIDPCKDFYGYACGGWMKKNPIPDGKSIWGTFGKLWRENQLILKTLLEKSSSQFNSEAEIKAKIYYQSCMDTNDTLEELGAKPLQDLLKRVGGWNVTGHFDITHWSLQDQLEILHNEYNFGGLFSWDVGEDDKNSSAYIIQIDQAGLTLGNRDIYLNKTENQKILSTYVDYMTKIGELLGGKASEVRPQMEAILEFETKLAEITIPSDQRRDEEKNYHRYTIKELNTIAPFLNWLHYFNHGFTQVDKRISIKDPVVVYAPEYFKNLTELIVTLGSIDDKIVLNNYLIWEMVHTLAPSLSKEFRDASKMLRKAMTGSDGSEESWRSCVTDTDNVLGFALGSMFVKDQFKGESKSLAEKMISDIKNAFIENFPALKWMDDETREKAKKKALSITEMIGFPEYILHPEDLDKKYSALQLQAGTYFQNNLNHLQFVFKQNLEKLGQEVNKTRWGMTPPTVNAYYTPTKNQIVFPAGILQAPYYDPSYPKSLNFGGMGVVMGHELTHAFDDQGREYDEHGNLHQWWNNRTIEIFNNRTKCFVDQYSKYQLFGKNINGKQTLGENIADNGGLKAAYKSFEYWLNEHEAEKLLPGLNLTHRQLFFLGFAQVWCSSSTKQFGSLQLSNDLHSPANIRVIGTLSNSVEFSQQFNCPTGSQMNPDDKCEVW